MTGAGGEPSGAGTAGGPYPEGAAASGPGSVAGPTGQLQPRTAVPGRSPTSRAGSSRRDGTGRGGPWVVGSDPGRERCSRPAPHTLPRRQFQAGGGWWRGRRGHAFNHFRNIAAKSSDLRNDRAHLAPRSCRGESRQNSLRPREEPRRAGRHGIRIPIRIPIPTASARSGGRSCRINAGRFEIRVPQ